MSTTRKNQDPLQSLFSQPPQGDVEPPDPAHVESPRPPAPGPDPAQVARMIAKAALAKAGPPPKADPPKPPPPKAEAPKPPPPKAAPAKAPAEAKGPARLAAPLPERKLSAAEAMEAARKAELAREAAEDAAQKAAAQKAAEKASQEALAKRLAQEAAARAAKPQAPPAVEAAPSIALPPASAGGVESAYPAVVAALPGLSLRLLGARLARDRGTLTALWKAHRMRFAANGDIERATAAAVVLAALGRLAPGDLVAVEVGGPKGEHLVWVDTRQKVVLAAFSDGGSLVAGL